MDILPSSEQVIKGMDILLGMTATNPPTATSTAILPAPTATSNSILTPATATVTLPVGIPIHQLYEGDDFFLLLVYSPSQTVVTCKFSPLTVEVKATGGATNPKELRKAFSLSESFLAEFNAQRLHEEREATYIIPLSAPIETSHQHIKKEELDDCIAYYLPFETHQDEFL